MKRTVVRRCASNDDPNVKQYPKTCEGDKGVCDGGVDWHHVPTETTGEEEESDLEHHRKALNEQVERPFLEPIALALAISAAFNR